MKLIDQTINVSFIIDESLNVMHDFMKCCIRVMPVIIPDLFQNLVIVLTKFELLNEFIIINLNYKYIMITVFLKYAT